MTFSFSLRLTVTFYIAINRGRLEAD